MIPIIDDPPQLTSGKGTPTTGASPITIAMFTPKYRKKFPATPRMISEAKRFFAWMAATMQVVEARKRGELGSSSSGKSYVRGLLDKGVVRIGEKLLEEAGELAAALDRESDERIASEAADLVFHVLVGLAARGLDLRDVEAVLAARHGLSGIDERRARGKSDDV